MNVLLFDLGGVVINWTGLQEMQKLLGHHHSLEEIRQKMAANPMAKRHGIGQCSSDEFLNSFIQDFNLPFSGPEFETIYTSWAGSPYPGVFERLQELRSNYKLVCLSNTNELHWEYLLNTVGIEDVFDQCFASHLLQKAKPDPEIYHAVLEELGLEPGNICFFDDLPENIETACDLGMKTCHVDASTGVLPHLKNISYF